MSFIAGKIKNTIKRSIKRIDTIETEQERIRLIGLRIISIIKLNIILNT